MMICSLSTKPSYGEIPGLCAKCGAQVWESLAMLDDAYNVWAGRCPACKAINLLSMGYGLRGYDSRQMYLVLPTDEEIAANSLPADTPSAGSRGPADLHGTPAGEMQHRLREAMGRAQP
jgi:hypothetical protein